MHWNFSTKPPGLTIGKVLARRYLIFESSLLYWFVRYKRAISCRLESFAHRSVCVFCAFHKHANCKVQKPTKNCAAVNHLSGPLRKQNYTLTRSKGHGLWFVIGQDFDPTVLCVSVFEGLLRAYVCDRNYDRRQRKTQLWRRLMNFRVRMFVKSAVTN